MSGINDELSELIEFTAGYLKDLVSKPVIGVLTLCVPWIPI